MRKGLLFIDVMSDTLLFGSKGGRTLSPSLVKSRGGVGEWTEVLVKCELYEKKDWGIELRGWGMGW